MPPRLASLRRPPLGFAHRGARAHAPENTIEAFLLARKLGATGLESDAWLTADDVVVLDHEGAIGGPLRRRPIRTVERRRLPAHIPELADLYSGCGNDFELSLDVKDPAAAGPAVALAREAGGGAPERLWLCHPDLDQVLAWRPLYPDVRLVDSTRLRKIRQGPERRAAELAAAGVDAVNLHHADWTGGLTTLFHRFEVLCLAWDAQHVRVLDALLDMGVDGVYSDHVDRMVDAIARL